MEVLLVCIGVALGSFLNVLTLRYDPDKEYGLKTVGGRSHCLYCGKQLSWYELIPLVSFIIQRGKCRGCKKKISWQYPVVEALSGVLWLVVPWVIHAKQFMLFGSYGISGIEEGIASALWIGAGMLMLAICIIDLKYYIIPNGLNMALAGTGAAWIIFHEYLGAHGGSFLGHFAQLFSLSDSFVVDHLAAGLIAGLIFLLIVILTKGKGMGVGDVKLIAALGLLFGWPDTPALAIMSFIIGTLGVLPLLIFGKKRISDRIPFGPSLILASVVIFIFGSSVFEGYFDIIQSLNM